MRRGPLQSPIPNPQSPLQPCPKIQAFRGIRYDLGHVGSLSDVIAPPYDVIGPQLLDELYRRHPCNFVRVDLNRAEPADDEADNRYTRAARLLKNWRSEGVLFEEAQPAIYVYHQEFVVDGQTHTRRGFIARMELSPFGEGQVFPHEQTMSGPKLDRLMLTVVTKANLSPVFGLYPDPQSTVDTLLDSVVGNQTPLVATDPWGAIHRMWPVSDVAVISEIAAHMAAKPVFIADGHHRYETACKYRDQIYDSGALRKDHPARYNADDVRGDGGSRAGRAADPPLVPRRPGDEFRTIGGQAGRPFHLATSRRRPRRGAERLGRPGDAWPTRHARLVYPRRQLLDNRPTDRGRSSQARRGPPPTITPAWRELGVSILHRLLVETLLGLGAVSQTKYVHDVAGVVEGLRSGEFPMAALVLPASVDHVRTISMDGDRMPAKSTYFYPKLLSGLVINPLE